MIRTKKEIIDEITSTIELVHEKSKKSMIHSIGWLNIIDNTAEKFKLDIEKTRLFNELEAGWEYKIEYNYNDFKLQLLHHEITFDDDKQPQNVIDQIFTLVNTPAPYLSTSEYASIYGVSETGVRAWIRRGKLRAAERIGNVWRIPALLAPPRVRGYQKASYSWETTLMDLHEEFNYLNDFKRLDIEQDTTDRKQFKIYLYPTDSVKETKVEILNTSERERLELMLISNPYIYYNACADEGLII